MPHTIPHLTDRGGRLYRILRESDGRELSVAEFIEWYIRGEPTLKGSCRSCGFWRVLVGGCFCMGCTAGTVRS